MGGWKTKLVYAYISETIQTLNKFSTQVLKIAPVKLSEGKHAIIFKLIFCAETKSLEKMPILKLN